MRGLALGQIERANARWLLTKEIAVALLNGCLLYTSDAADERSSVDLGGRRIIKKKKNTYISGRPVRKKK